MQSDKYTHSINSIIFMVQKRISSSSSMSTFNSEPSSRICKNCSKPFSKSHASICSSLKKTVPTPRILLYQNYNDKVGPAINSCSASLLLQLIVFLLLYYKDIFHLLNHKQYSNRFPPGISHLCFLQSENEGLTVSHCWPEICCSPFIMQLQSVLGSKIKALECKQQNS